MTVAECVWMGARDGVSSVEAAQRAGVQNAASDSLRQQLVALEAQIPSRLSQRQCATLTEHSRYHSTGKLMFRDSQTAILAVGRILSPLGSFGQWIGNDCGASEPAHQSAKRSAVGLEWCPAGNATSCYGSYFVSHPIVNLMGIALENKLERVHTVLCMRFASTLDKSSSWTLSEAFMPEGSSSGSSGLLKCLSERSALEVMSHISLPGLERLLKVCPPWSSLLSSQEARMVFEHRMHPAAELLEVLMQPNDGSCCPSVSWLDAFHLYGALLNGEAALDPLPRLLGSILEKIAMQSPKHLGHLTMFAVVLHAIEAGAQRQHAAPGHSHCPVAPGQAAAEVFFSAVQHLHASLQSRLAYIAACAESSSAVSPTEHLASEYFTILSQSRELLSRAQELAVVSFPQDVTAVFQRQVSRLADGLLLNFGVSDRAVTLAATLPTAIASTNPAIGRLLSAMFFRVLPETERERLGLVLPTVRALDEGALAKCKVSYVCQAGAKTSEVPFSLLKSSLGTAAAHVRLFWKWRTLHCAPTGRSVPDFGSCVDEDVLQGAPLNVSLRAFGEVIDFARIGCMTSIIGDCSVQQRQFKQSWMQQVLSSSPASRASILHCAQVLGCTEIVQGMQNCMQ